MVHDDDAIKLANVTEQYNTTYNARTHSTLLTVPLSDSQGLRTQFAVQSVTPDANDPISATVSLKFVPCQQKYTVKERNIRNVFLLHTVHSRFNCGFQTRLCSCHVG